jgi:hypothetical protein
MRARNFAELPDLAVAGGRGASKGGGNALVHGNS